MDAFGALAFAIAPWYSTFIRQDGGVSCHPACLLMLHCALSRRVVNGELQVPQDRLCPLRKMAQAILYYGCFKLSHMYTKPKFANPLTHAFFAMARPNIRFFIVFSMPLSCVNRRYV